MIFQVTRALTVNCVLYTVFAIVHQSILVSYGLVSWLTEFDHIPIFLDLSSSDISEKKKAILTEE